MVKEFKLNDYNLIQYYPEALEIRNKLLSLFNDLVFDEESHTYWLDEEKLPSVSSLIKYFYEDFKEEIKIGYCEKMGFDVGDVSNAWIGEGDIANSAGTRVHLYGENYVNWRWFGIGERPKVHCKQELAVLQFWNDIERLDEKKHRFIPVFTELKMYSRKYKYAGTADIICWDMRDKKLVIMDYKTNKELESEFKKEAFIIGKETGLLQDNLSKYKIQFSFYRILLEEAGFKVGGQVLIWLREQEKNENRIKNLYKTITTPNLTKYLRLFLSGEIK
jgi:hypothetical protein